MKFLKISLSTKGEVRQDKRMNNYNYGKIVPGVLVQITESWWGYGFNYGNFIRAYI